MSEKRIKVDLENINDLLIIAEKSYKLAEPSNTGILHPDFNDYITYEKDKISGLEMNIVNGRKCYTKITLEFDGQYYLHADEFAKRESNGIIRNDPIKFLNSIL